MWRVGQEARGHAVSEQAGVPTHGSCATKDSHWTVGGRPYGTVMIRHRAAGHGVGVSSGPLPNPRRLGPHSRR
eukprot:4034766-Pyramimonas_sp.AAC.1